MSYDLFKQVIPSIINKTGNLNNTRHDTTELEKHSFMLKRIFSYEPLSLMMIAELESVSNKRFRLPPGTTYEYLYSIIQQGVRFNMRTAKQPKITPEIKAVAEAFNVSYARAKQLMVFLDDKDIETLVNTGRVK